MTDPAAPIGALRNLGPKSAAMLRAAGITTIAELSDAGALDAYARVRAIWSGASLNLLWALAAGLQGRDWRDLAAVEKRALLDALTAAAPPRAGTGRPPARRRRAGTG